MSRWSEWHGGGGSDIVVRALVGRRDSGSDSADEVVVYK